MAKSRGGVEHSAVSTNTTIKTSPSIYYGCIVHNLTTAGVKALIYDAKATAQGDLTDVVVVAAGTNANARSQWAQGVIMHSGIHVQALVCTSAADSIIVFYGGV